jgi:adenine-specific DNA methylase
MVRDSKALGEDWFPAAEVSVESIRERSSMTALPPIYYLHVWFARRPLVSCRATIFSILSPKDFDKRMFLQIVGIPPDKDVVGAMQQVTKMKAINQKIENPYTWSRAFTVIPPEKILPQYLQKKLVVDPMAGGGSIPYESIRLGINTMAGDLNQVAWICLKGTIDFPARFGRKLLSATEQFCNEIHNKAKKELESYFPKSDMNNVLTYLWARTIRCKNCNIEIPLSPNWWIVNGTEKDVAVRLKISEDRKTTDFEILHNPLKYGYNPDKGTWADGDALCPSCGSVVDGAYIKLEAQSGRMGHRMYAVCCKTPKSGKIKSQWLFRTPTNEESEILQRLEKEVKAKIPEWKRQGLIPTEKFPEDASDTRPITFGMPYWHDMFNHRQLLTHATYLNKFNEEKKKLFEGKTKGTNEWEFAAAVSIYAAMIFDTCLDYNCILSLWHPNRQIIAHMMGLQGYPFKSSYAEWNQIIPGAGFEWAQQKVLKAVKELIELLPEKPGKSNIYLGSAINIPLGDKEADAVVVDPPYGENVMYSEMSDFFYVWLKLMLSDIFTEEFKAELTNKADEAVVNTARFADIGRGQAKKLADQDYAAKMEASFKEMNRILKDDGIMAVMFTHRRAEAWEGLAESLMRAGFTFRASWPVHTEPSMKFGKADKAALKVTVLLFCRKRSSEKPGRWEDICEKIREIAEMKVKDYSMSGIEGPDLLVSIYGPALGVFADYYPVKDATGKIRSPKEALDIVAYVVNEFITADLKGADLETMAYLNLLRLYPELNVEADLARIATVFGGNTSLDMMDVKSGRGLVEKKGSKVHVLTGRERVSRGIVNPNKPGTLQSLIDVVHAALINYQELGLASVKTLLTSTGRDMADSGFLNVVRAIARLGERGNEELMKEARIANALLEAMGHQPEVTLKKGESLTHWIDQHN